MDVILWGPATQSVLRMGPEHKVASFISQEVDLGPGSSLFTKGSF